MSPPLRSFTSSLLTTSAPRVLVVDDDEDLRAALADILEAEGYEVAVAADGQEALEVLREEHAPLPGLVLLDMMMPVMDGWEFCAHQKRDPKLAHVPVLVLSASADVERAAAELGAQGYLRKPMDIDALLGAVARHLGGGGGGARPGQA